MRDCVTCLSGGKRKVGDVHPVKHKPENGQAGAWERFEHAVDVAVKSGPKHRTAKPQTPKPHKPKPKG